MATRLDRSDFGGAARATRPRPQRALNADLVSVARAGDDRATHQAAMRIAASHDEALADAVADFDPERIVTIGRVVRALIHHPGLLGHDADVAPWVEAIADISADGARWRLARLPALAGREHEREHLRLLGVHRRRLFADGLGGLTGGAFQPTTAAGAFTIAAHQARIALECGRPGVHIGRVSNVAAIADLERILGRMPGRVRRRLLLGAPGDGGRSGMYELAYEGIDAHTDMALMLSFRFGVGRVETQTAGGEAIPVGRVVPDGLAPVEGIWACDDGDRDPATSDVGTLRNISGVEVPSGRGPRRSRDELLGPMPTCIHRQAQWSGGRDVMVSATCVDCGAELLRRPRTSVDALMPGGPGRREAYAREILPQVKGLACLMGLAPPADAEELLSRPRCDDWRAERARVAEATHRQRARSARRRWLAPLR